MKALLACAALAAALTAPVAALADDDAMGRHSENPVTLAVFGDWPYNTVLLDSAHLLVDSINGDPDVRLVLHVGDIHGGSMPCTGAGLDPLPAGANPAWNQGIFDIFEQFDDAFVYTPGDNEWTDCHKKKELSSGAPLNELAAIRALFFAHPGRTLGAHPRRVLSQARAFDRIHLADAQYVENVMWEQAGVVFATVNMPGSNNDGFAWSALSPTRRRGRARRRSARERRSAGWTRRSSAPRRTMPKACSSACRPTCGIPRPRPRAATAWATTPSSCTS